MSACHILRLVGFYFSKAHTHVPHNQGKKYDFMQSKVYNHLNFLKIFILLTFKIFKAVEHHHIEVTPVFSLIL